MFFLRFFNLTHRQNLKMWERQAGTKDKTFRSCTRKPTKTKKAKKGEDRGKPSLRRTIRVDVPGAHEAKKQVRRDDVELQTKNKGLLIFKVSN